MFKMPARCLSLSGGALLALSLSACATLSQQPSLSGVTDAQIAKVLWRGAEGGSVYRVAAESAARTPLDQPVQLDATWLREFLASLELTSKGSDGTTKLTIFNDQQLDRLVPALVRGLANSQADQELVFTVAGPLPGVRLFDQDVSTSGRVFVANGRLNIILGRALETVFDDSAKRDVYTPGSRRANQLDADVKVHSSLWAVSRERRDWVSIDIQQGAGPLPTLPESAPEPVTTPTTTQTTAPASGSGAAAVAPAAATSPREQLEMLKQLYEDKLITREEYAQERAEVLDAL